MIFSIVATFSGVNLGYVKRALDAVKLPYTETDRGESEYKYLAGEHGYAEDSPPAEDDESFWAGWYRGVYDVDASGILDAESFRKLCGDLGLTAEDVQTMGTLGGPLGIGCVPDVVFRMEAEDVLDSIRVTPIPTDRKGEPLHGDERTFERVRRATLAVYA